MSKRQRSPTFIPATPATVLDLDFDNLDGGLDKAIEDINEFGSLSLSHKHLPHLSPDEEG